MRRWTWPRPAERPQPAERPEAAERPEGFRPLLPTASRPLAAALLAVCVIIAALLGAWFMHQARAGWLDAAVDARVRAGLGGHPAILNFVVQLGDPIPVTVMASALVIACLAARRWRGVVFAAVSVTAAALLTERVLKPLIDRTAQGHLEFPSGHATGTFALAAVCAVLLAAPPRLRWPGALRLCTALAAFLIAGAVAIAVIARGYHYFTDTVGGAAVGTAVVLATAFIVDRFSPGGHEPDAAGHKVGASGHKVGDGGHKVGDGGQEPGADGYEPRPVEQVSGQHGADQRGQQQRRAFDG